MTTLLNANNKWYESYTWCIYIHIIYIYTYISVSTYIGTYVRICQKALNKMAMSCAK